MVNARDKYLALKRIVDYLPNIYGIIFCRTRATTQEVAAQLIQDGYNADALHGDLSQAQRDAVMKKFREHSLQLLVATDVAARGLDVDNLTHIISYSLPDDNDVYNHRSGRTGRAGKKGVSIALIHSRERSKLRQIEKHIGKTFERREVPKPKEIIEKRLFNLADKLEKVEVREEEIETYLGGVIKKLSWLTSEELLKRVLSVEFNRLIDYYKNAPALDYVPEKKEKKSKKDKQGKRYDDSRTKQEKDSRVAEEGFERIYVNAGKADGFFVTDLIGLINANTNGKRIDIGRIDLLSGYSLFDVKAGQGQTVVNALKNADFYGKRIYSEFAKPDKDYAREGKHSPKADRKARFSRDRDRAKGKPRHERGTRRDAERGFKKKNKD